MKKRKIILIGLLVGALVCGGGYGAYRLVKGNTTPVDVTPVAYLNLGWWNSETTSSGTITSNAVQEVQLDNDKMISQINVKEGDRVKIGDVLMTYDATLLELNLESAQLGRKTTELELLSAKEELAKLQKITPVADPVDVGSSSRLSEDDNAEEVSAGLSAMLVTNEVTARTSSQETAEGETISGETDGVSENAAETLQAEAPQAETGNDDPTPGETNPPDTGNSDPTPNET